MKIYPAITFILLISPLVPSFGQISDLKIYGIKSGKIDYQYSGSQEGVGTLYFDDYGFRSMKFEDLIENEKHRHLYTISIGEYQYIYDPNKPEEGVKKKNSLFNDFNKEDNPDSLLVRMYKKKGLKKTGNILFRDRSCELWTGEQGQAFTWNRILLKLDLAIYDNILHQEATSISINIPVDSSIFEIPAEVEFMEMPGFTF